MKNLSKLRMLCLLSGALYSVAPCCAMDGEQPKSDRNPEPLKEQAPKTRRVGIPVAVLEAAGYTVLTLANGSHFITGPNSQQNVSNPQTKNANG